MKHWHIIVLLCMFAAAAGLVVAFPPGTRRVSQYNPTPTPTAVPTSLPGQATMVFFGDIMLSRSVGDAMAAHGDWLWPFRLIASTSAGADLAFANLESVISDRGQQLGCGFCFRADPRAMAGLTFAGLDVVSVANNHAWDYGSDAFIDSARRLTEAGIAPVGAGAEPVIRKVGDARVAILAYTDILPRSACTGGANCYDSEQMPKDIARARTLADIVIVSFHTGDEYMLANAKQENIYHAAMVAGADLVVGHHPHVVQKFERYDSGWIAYSLGNFVFDQNFSAPTMTGMMLVATIQDRHLVSVEPRTILISRGYQPSLAPGP